MSGRRIVRLLDGAIGVGAGAAFAFHTLNEYRPPAMVSATLEPPLRRFDKGVFQVERGGGAINYTVVVAGRMSPAQAWFTLGTLTQANEDANASSSVIVDTWPEMRAEVTAHAGGAAITAIYQE